MEPLSQAPPAGPRPPRWTPNALTALRIALVPAFLAHARWCAQEVEAGGEGAVHRALAVGALVGIGVSDVLDGWIARRFGWVTRLGATLDAFADKLAQVSILLFFVVSGGPAFAPVPLWFVIVILGRDVVLVVGSLLVRWRIGAVEVVHHTHGRASTVLLFGILFWITTGLAREPLPAAYALSSALVLGSTFFYMRDGWRQVVAARGGSGGGSTPPRRGADENRP